MPKPLRAAPKGVVREREVEITGEGRRVWRLTHRPESDYAYCVEMERLTATGALVAGSMEPFRSLAQAAEHYPQLAGSQVELPI